MRLNEDILLDFSYLTEKNYSGYDMVREEHSFKIARFNETVRRGI